MYILYYGKLSGGNQKVQYHSDPLRKPPQLPATSSELCSVLSHTERVQPLLTNSALNMRLFFPDCSSLFFLLFWIAIELCCMYFCLSRLDYKPVLCSILSLYYTQASTEYTEGLDWV